MVYRKNLWFGKPVNFKRRLYCFHRDDELDAQKDARAFGCTGFSYFRMAAGGEFVSGEEFDLYFDNLDFIEPDNDEELSAAFAEAVDEVCIINSVLKKPKPLRLCAWKMRQKIRPT